MQCQSTEQINTPIYIGVCRLNDRLSKKCTPILTGLEHARPAGSSGQWNSNPKTDDVCCQSSAKKKKIWNWEYMYTVDVYCYSIGHNSKEKMNLNKEKNITFFFGQHAIDVYV